MYDERLDFETATCCSGYGLRGLHIALFEDWNEDKDRLIEALAAYRIERFGCNHCTGATAVQKMLAAGLPVVRGSQ